MRCQEDPLLSVLTDPKNPVAVVRQFEARYHDLAILERI